VVFDYFFPDLLPGSPISIPQSLMTNWETTYWPQVMNALIGNQDKAIQLLQVTGGAYDPNDPLTTGGNTVKTVLWYNIFGTNDAIAKLGGLPFDNTNTHYTGSTNDTALNAGVQRFSADPAAQAELAAHYQTNGQVLWPMVTLHTSLDEIVPYWHEISYTAKVNPTWAGMRYQNIQVQRYGHCNFTQAEVLQALNAMLAMKTAMFQHSLYLPVID
jgi:hypothetical protein